MYEAQSAYQRLQISLTSESAASAISEIKTFLKMFPDMALAHNDLGVLYHQCGENLLALAHYEKANRIQPKTATIIKNIAEFYAVELGWIEDAIMLLTDQLRATPQDDEILVSLGMISARVRRPDEARAFFKQALTIRPGDTAIREALAQLEGPVSAVEYRSPISPVIEQAASAVPTDEYAAEVAAFRQALSRNPADAVANNNLAVILSRQGNYEEAANLYLRAANSDPGNPMYRKNLADLYYAALGRTDDAVEIYTSLLKQYPQDTELLFAAAIISKANNLAEQARIFIGKILEVEPWNSAARELMSGLPS
jgi:tetratricopeptide (TPR) repeat protein